MIVLRDMDALPAGLRFALTIGMFDGVHPGHRRVVAALTDAATDLDAVPVVLTFDPHPASVLRGQAPPLLCDASERLAMLAELGVEIVVDQRFDRAFADQSAEEFLARLCAGRNLCVLVLTGDSTFGRDRSAGLADVRRLAPRFGYRVIEVASLARDGAPLSSTRLRALVTEGRLSKVARHLGRPYALVGEVVTGDRRGHELGYPTANLHFEQPVALPPDGIYAVRVSWPADIEPARRQHANGVASLGVRPTFGDGGARILEVHLFDFSGDLYGQRLRVELVGNLRGERRFSSAAALVRQMDRDAIRARALLGA